MESKKNLELKVVLTGGGTGGHVIPHLVFIPEMQRRSWKLFYIGSKGIEKKIITAVGLPYYQIHCGKLRRYLSVENFFDVFKVLIGILQSLFILLKLRPQFILSKGGFVSVPVCVAGFVLGIPIYSHESDFTPGLATRIIARFAKKIFCAFKETVSQIPNGRGYYSGQPIRSDLLNGDRQRGFELCQFRSSSVKPVILIMGGSQGAQKINAAVIKALKELIKEFQVIHICGEKADLLSPFQGDYKAFSFVNEELKHLMCAADLIVSRAGANSIFEFLSLSKPMLLIPLEIGSRGDQVDNAKNFQSHGWAKILPEKLLDSESLVEAIRDLFRSQQLIREAQMNYQKPDVANLVISQILNELSLMT